MLTFVYSCVVYVHLGSDGFSFKYNTKLNIDNLSAEIEFLSLLLS